MIFGNSKDFAIEAYHEPSGPKWGGCGRLCLHIQGVMVGNIRENHCSLFAVTDILRNVAGKIDGMWRDCFLGLSDAEVFCLINNENYTDEPPSKLGSGFSSFDFLTNSAEMFDHTKTFIFCDPDGQVHVLYRLSDDTLGSGACNVSTFRKEIDAYAHWFDEQVRSTAPPYFPINPFDPNEKLSGDENNRY